MAAPTNETMVVELVARIARVLDLAECSCIDSLTNRVKLAEGREALTDIAGFFDIEAPKAKLVERA
ncbi:hypothetical protein SAMN05216456_1937 [Devosia crocina]|uniref:Uncharacterized protein n=1 Tax=Devosia crocina TaxID=429728 RepID=A0A1I7NF23_9HYPH|nr:hypothetical protein [Devosia crocina]SFV33261.1 hypothetical protein SAMN05216456_1937 [Devosia crocina]